MWCCVANAQMSSVVCMHMKRKCVHIEAAHAFVHFHMPHMDVLGSAHTHTHKHKHKRRHAPWEVEFILSSRNPRTNIGEAFHRGVAARDSSWQRCGGITPARVPGPAGNTGAEQECWPGPLPQCSPLAASWAAVMMMMMLQKARGLESLKKKKKKDRNQFQVSKQWMIDFSTEPRWQCTSTLRAGGCLAWHCGAARSCLLVVL